MSIIRWFKNYSRPYRNAFRVLKIQGFDILKYIYWYVPNHKKIFEALKHFKNIHKGERCFIVATGPSLTLEDVNKLKGEICWTCNSGIMLFDKTDWRPDYYAISDGGVFKRIGNLINSSDFKAFFYNQKDIQLNIKNSFPLPTWVNLIMDHKTRNVIPIFFRKKRMSKDISKKIFMGSSVINIIIQVCIYMGFKEIYLLGCDCTYFGKGEDLHSKLTSYEEDKKDNITDNYVNWSILQDHKAAKKFADKMGVKIYNATRGGMLEEYPRVNLDEVLGLKG